jgi:hypothetical protein
VSESLLSQDYIIQNIYTYCKRALYKPSQSAYNAECCICNEGKSSGKKRRLFYFTQKRYFYCFNCSKSWNEIQWLQEAASKSYIEILNESNGFIIDIKPTTLTKLSITQDKDVAPLPQGCISLEDSCQIEFYKDNKRNYKRLLHAVDYCVQRRLFTAINRSKHLYVSFNDKKHCNRLVIPFYDYNGTLACYQSRALLNHQFPKYITKEGEKCFYGEDKIDPLIPYIFIFEGPIDAMFVRNAVAMAGTDVSFKQQQFLNKCIGYEKIFVYDNDIDNVVLTKKIKKRLSNNDRVFIWPKKFSKYKDVNEICCKLGLDEFAWKFIVENSFTGTEGNVKYTLNQKFN